MLARVYSDMVRRVKGRSGTKRPDLYRGLPCDWPSFAEFREFALAHGFSKATPSIDRIDPARGYTADNVRFVSVQENRLKAIGQFNGHDDVRGEEPPDDAWADLGAELPPTDRELDDGLGDEYGDVPF